MLSLRQELLAARQAHVALGHFNISDLAGLKGIVGAAVANKAPVMIGVSEGERDFIGVRQVAALVKSIRDELQIPIFLNADHTHSLEKIQEAVEAGFDEVLFDAGKETLEENIEETKKAVAFVKEYNVTHGTDVLIEGELGYIGGGSVILDRIPEGISIKPEDLTKPEDAARFVRETGIDMLAPAVGNLHGMFADAPNPNIDIDRIRAIAAATDAYLVLHGGSGIVSEQFKQAIAAGICVVHINTELRLAWRRGMDLSLLSHPKEITPYKILPEVAHEIERVVDGHLKIFFSA
jgi:fructose-bisphosphate aldolase class II